MDPGSARPIPRWGVAVVLGGWLLVGAAVWNDGPAPVWDLDERATVTWDYRRDPLGEGAARNGKLTLTPAGVLVLREAIWELPPSRNPLRILFEHVWFNARTDYDLKVWIDGGAHGYMGLYQSGSTVFVRRYPQWRNVVLVSERSPEQLEALLRPHFVPKERK